MWVKVNDFEAGDQITVTYRGVVVQDTHVGYVTLRLPNLLHVSLPVTEASSITTGPE